MIYCGFGLSAAIYPVWLTSRSSTSLTVEWNIVLYDGNQSAPLYNISYQGSNCFAANSTLINSTITTITLFNENATVINDTRLGYGLTQLSKWTSYNVKVTALLSNFSIIEEGNEYTCETTLQDGKLL